jgi:hypothetical protein
VSRAATFIERSSPAGPARATLARIVLPRTLAALALTALAGCGSVAELPPAAGPAHSPPLTERPAGRVVPAGRATVPGMSGAVAAADGGHARAVLSARERMLEVDDGDTRERVPAGVGPTHVVAGPGRLIYVVDTTGDGLLVYELRPHLHLTRRLPILGRPYGIAADPVRGRLWVTTTATNRLVELADGARPHRLRSFPAVRQPDSVAVDHETGRVYVGGRVDGEVQLLDPPPLRSR